MILTHAINHLNIDINPLSHQSIEVQNAITSLMKAFDDGIHHNLPWRFHLAPIDCGLGKTTALCRYIYHWKRCGFLPDNGVLIIVPTLDDIEPIVTNSGLEDSDYAIQTPDERFSEKGLGAAASNSAKVLFITHAMLKKRLAKKRFLQADEFAYRGRPRALRVCDEAILPAEPINLSVDKLLGLVAPFRPFDEPYVEQILAFVKVMRASALGSVIRVPPGLRKLPNGYSEASDKARATLTPEQHDMVQMLSMAVGRKLRLMDAKKFGRALVGCGRSLPDDLAPMIIMDASARMRTIYDVWEQQRGNLVRLPSAINSYENLTINIWKRASGRTTLATESHRIEILDAVAAIINRKPSEKWIVVCPKDNKMAGLTIAAELRPRLHQHDNVGFVTWGRHVGSNTYRDRRNVVVIGALRVPDLTYQARYMAVSGKPADTFDGNEWTKIWKSELQDALLQAICRSNVRNSRNGVCGECNVHLIMTSNPDPVSMMARLFPGATVKAWQPVLPKLSGQASRLVEKLIELQDGGTIMISKERIRTLCGIDDRSRLSQLLAHANVRAHLTSLGISHDHGNFRMNAMAIAA